MACLSPKNINNIITQNNLSIKKNLGQNFLCDESVLNNIVDLSGVDENSYVLEIGPGLGALTDRLLDRAKKVIAVEIDKGLCGVLREKYKDKDNFILIEGDFLELTDKKEIKGTEDFIAVLTNSKKLNALNTASGIDKNVENFESIKQNGQINLKCVANLPYYITSPIIMRLLELPFVGDITIMVQKEVGERIFALPRTKDYGVLTLMVQYYSTPADSFVVTKDCFYPKPNVDNMVVKLDKNNNSYYYQTKNSGKINSATNFIKLIKESFSQRRKRLINSLSSTSGIEKEAIKASLIKIGFDENARAEELTLENYIELYSSLC